MQTVIIKNPVSIEKIKQIAKEQLGDFVKMVVDVEKKVIAVGGDLHADEEAILLEGGSK